MRIRHTVACHFKALCMALAIMVLAGCATEKIQPVAPLSAVSVGIVGAIQPMGTTDLLAGYIPEGRELAPSEALIAFDDSLLDQVKAQADKARTIVPIPSAKGVNPSQPRSAERNTALTHWVAVGKKANVELIIVPQILNWHERQGSNAGVVSSAEVDVQFYLIDTVNATLVSRSVYREKQQSLAGNLLDAKTFFKRGGKWVTAQQLADEGIAKMIQEFGL